MDRAGSLENGVIHAQPVLVNGVATEQTFLVLPLFLFVQLFIKLYIEMATAPPNGTNGTNGSAAGVGVVKKVALVTGITGQVWK